MKNKAIRKICVRAIIVLFLLGGSALHSQTLGARPGVAFYSGAAGFEGLLEGRFAVPLFEDGPGEITTSAFIGYSHVGVEEARKSGLMLGAGLGYRFGLGLEGVYGAPGLIFGAEFSQFEETAVESDVALMLIPYLETGYEFDFNLSVGLQLGLKSLLYTGEDGAAERSFILGPVVHYSFGG